MVIELFVLIVFTPINLSILYAQSNLGLSFLFNSDNPLK